MSAVSSRSMIHTPPSRNLTHRYTHGKRGPHQQISVAARERERLNKGGFNHKKGVGKMEDISLKDSLQRPALLMQDMLL